MWEEGKPYLCVPRQAELSRVTQRVLGSTCCISVPIPGLLPSATRALIKGLWSHPTPGPGMVGSTQPVCFIMTLALASSGPDLGVRGREKGDGTARMHARPHARTHHGPLG